jgi:hypothetical protein
MNQEEYVHAKTAEEAEEKLVLIIKKYGLEKYTSISEIRDFILKDTGGDVRSANNRYFKMVLSVLVHIGEDVNDALQAFVDAWNWFPHGALKGKSPQDMLEEATSRNEPGEFMGGFSPVHIFGELYRISRTRALREHTRLKGTPREFARIENMLKKMRSNSDQQRVSEFIGTHGIELLRRIRATMPETVELFMRETQAMINHCLLDSEEGIGSPILWHALDTLMVNGDLLEDFDVPLFMTTLLEGHQSIDAFAEAHELDYRVISVAHHGLDWLAMENPWIFIEEQARKLAALAFGIVGEAHEAVVGMSEIAGTKKELMQLGRWKSQKKFAEELSEAFTDVLYAVKDPHMLIPFAEEAPDNWFSRLKSIAPDLESEWDDANRR